MQEILRVLLPETKRALDFYTRTLLRLMRLRLVSATYLWLRLMTVRTKIYEKRHGGDGA